MIKVLVVDDSALVRQLLTSILSEDPGIEVVGSAADPFVAREKIKKLNPDVLTLDVEMPRMDGVTFLGNLMRLRPMPVVMVSTLTEQGADVTLRALEAGAVDFVSKPKLDVAHELPEYSEEIIGKVKTAAKARVRALERRAANKTSVTEKLSADAVLSKPVIKKHFRTTDRIIGIGSSTGGTEAIKDVVRDLPPDMPGIVISQHIPEAFSGPFAQRVNSITALTVVEATDGQQVLQGHVYIAPGNRHLIIQRDGARYICKLNDGPPVNRHKPSVDVMFRSLSQNAGANAIAVMLTGMGDDGAAGMGEMRQAGSPTIAQDERTSVVWGMPGEAVKRGFVKEVLSLNKIGKRLQELSSE
ncbi:MAG: chemotaxis response regulator protein-glutamate methylesterase [gamma proteobacterium endosymbiont of Lamellibrachia anaximandri]|nr:chemotaxis response regulator protein-glutamate methylesterase [gamma proteobacterium endosymbiont of Lamellibrachia anaximandri]MBL3534521.1 chemotaxis response regulator protein-glutamate methylesterase [gamma proteobacterium endosymbiont of Lamellibrachia anaximandri]MBL3600366.1 chemotaxis response regulator protein-glutamate methylesterase [gamma proteobacterium endosymbiont of Lamellibrachia anaximandri]